MSTDPSSQSFETSETNQSDSAPDAPVTEEQSQESAPMGRPLQSGFHSYPSTPATGANNRVLYAVGGACVLLLLFGITRMVFFGGSGDTAPKPQVRSIYSEQQQMMREAMQMAREAQQMQRENMQRMHDAMYEAEFGGYSEDIGYGAYGTGAERYESP